MQASFNFLVGGLLTPSNALCLMLAVGCVWLILSRRRHGFLLILISTLILSAIAVLPISTMAVLPLEDRFPQPAMPDHIDGIVVLGGSVVPSTSKARGRPTVRESSDRLFAAIALARQYPDARVILAGGIVMPKPGAIPESWVMRDVLVAAGVDSKRIEMDIASRNTWENAQYARDLAHPLPGQIWLLVTSANHMPRSVGSFRQAGFPVLPYPVDYLTPGEVKLGDNAELSKELRRLDIAIHEWIGLLGYRALGWTNEWFPGPG